MSLGPKDKDRALPVVSALDDDDILVTPTITAGAYVANDAVGGKLVFPNAVPKNGNSCYITKVRIIDNAKQDAELELHLFTEDFTAMADNGAWNPSDADMQHWSGYIPIPATSYADGSNNSGASKATGLMLPFHFISSNDRHIRGQLVTRGAPTYSATDDITVIITVERRR